MSAHDLRQRVGQRVKRERERCGFSQPDLARIVGCHPSEISRVERAVSLPTLPFLLSLAAALELTPNDLLL